MMMTKSGLCITLTVGVLIGCGADTSSPAPTSSQNPPEAARSQDTVTDLDSAAHVLASLSKQDVRQYACYDFGRAKDTTAISVVVPETTARELVDKMRDRIESDLVVFIGTTRWLGEDRPDGVEVVVGKGTSQFDIIRLARSDAVNHDMLTEDLIKQLKKYDDQFGIRIFHAETDTIQFELESLPNDLSAFARDLYRFCPDIVDQGVGTVAALEEAIRQSKQVDLWWD